MLSPEKLLIVVGGGVAADEVRRLDVMCGLPAAQAHWAAIAAMTLNAGVISRLCGELPIVSGRIDAEKAWGTADAVLLDSTEFLRAEQAGHGRALPNDWSVTSDSIAAFVALHWPARQLVFCKSCDQEPHPQQLKSLDDWFPNLLELLRHAGVELGWLNLRGAIRRPEPFVPTT